MWTNLGQPVLFRSVALMILVTAVAPPGSAQEQKIRVAVLNFDTYLVESTEWQFPWAASGLGPLATSLLTGELASHKRFTVIERRYIDDLLQEQNLGGSGRVNQASAAQIGQLLGAQVVVVGDVEEFGTRKSGGIGGAALGVLGARQEKMTVKLGARMIDASTGEILETSKSEADVNQGALGVITASAGGIIGTELEGEASKVMREAIVKLAEDIASKSEEFDVKPIIPCLDGMVATVAANRVYLTLGSSTSIAVGDYFKIRDRQAPILDPSTGDTLGYVEIDKGYVQVLEVQGRMSVAEVVDGSGFATGHGAVRSGPPGDNTACIPVRGMSDSPPASSTPAQPAPAQPAPAQPAPATVAGGVAQPVIVPAAAAAPTALAPAQGSAAVAPPSASTESPIGEWHLDGEETMNFWIRSFRSAIPMYASTTDEEFKKSMGAQLEQWRANLNAMAFNLTLGEDGTFHIAMQDPATMTLSTVDGTWRKEGLLFVLTGTHIDGLAVAESHDEHLKMGNGRMFGQNPDFSNQGSAAWAAMITGWRLAWPDLSGAAFVRSQ